MILNQLIIRGYGPFEEYEIVFPEDADCLLLTGKNNEGKSNIIAALRLLSFATKVIGKRKQMFTTANGVFYKLLVQDTQEIDIKKSIFNYTDELALIVGIFNCDLKITVYLNPIDELVYASYEGKLPENIEDFIGIMPPLEFLWNEQFGV